MATQPSDSSKYRVRNSAPDELAVIAQRAQAFTNASGAAIALAEGNADEIVCRARSGSSAPDIGVSLRVEGTFTGICIQTGKELRCDDAETDTRVDSTAIRALGIRSMVVTPIKEEHRVTGVLAVFAPTPHAFTITHVAVLKTMADQIALHLQRERRAKEEGIASAAPAVILPKPPASVSIAPVAPLPGPTAPAPLPTTSVAPASPASVTPMRPVFSGGAASAPAPARIIAPVTPLPVAQDIATPKIEPTKVETPKFETSRIEPLRGESLKPVPVAEEIAVPAPPLIKREERPEEKRVEFKSEPAVRPGFGTLDSMAAEPAAKGGKTVLIGVVAAVLVAGAFGAYFMVHKQAPAAVAKPADQTPQTAAVTPQNTGAAGPAAATSGPATASTAGVPAQSQTAGVEVANSKPEKADNRKTESQRKPANLANQDTQAQSAQQTPEAVTLASGPSKIVPVHAQPPSSSPDVAPPVVGSGSSQAALNSLARSTTSSAHAVLAAPEPEPAFAPPVLKRKITPVYPSIARLQRASGTVVIRVTVGKDGKVNNPQFVSGPIVFKDSAFEAVRQWLYAPATQNGKPIEQEAEIKLNFHPL